MLCCVVLCCVVLGRVVSCCVALHCVVSGCVVLWARCCFASCRVSRRCAVCSSYYFWWLNRFRTIFETSYRCEKVQYYEQQFLTLTALVVWGPRTTPLVGTSGFICKRNEQRSEIYVTFSKVKELCRVVPCALLCCFTFCLNYHYRRLKTVTIQSVHVHYNRWWGGWGAFTWVLMDYDFLERAVIVTSGN